MKNALQNRHSYKSLIRLYLEEEAAESNSVFFFRAYKEHLHQTLLFKKSPKYIENSYYSDESIK